MNVRFSLIIFLLGTLLFAVAGCGSSSTPAPASNPGQSAPVGAPVGSNPTSAPTAEPSGGNPATVPSPTPLVISTVAPSPTAEPAVRPSATQSVAQPTTPPSPSPLPLPTSGSPTATLSAAANAPSGNPLDLILNAEQSRLKQPTRATIVSTDSATPNQSSTTTVEYQPPDRIHEVMPSQEVIAIQNQGTWMKINGQWQKSPVDLASTIFASFSPQAIQELKNNIQVNQIQFAGPDILNGKPMWVYTYTTTFKGTNGSGDYTATSKMWIGATDQLPYKVESDAPSLVNKGATVHSVITYDYDPSINIQAPS